MKFVGSLDNIDNINEYLNQVQEFINHLKSQFGIV